MNHATHNAIVSFIWSIADDVLRDLYVRGKYRDVILPMTVLRRLDVVLESTKQAVLDMKARLDKAHIVYQESALRQTAGQAFYNTSRFTLRDLKSRASQQQLKADFEAYLDGFSSNVQDILENFEFRNQIPRLSKADALATLIDRFLSPDINLSPNPVVNVDGSIKYAGLDNHGMGTVFEELVRRFNEENNEEAGEHWTPRDAVQTLSRLNSAHPKKSEVFVLDFMNDVDTIQTAFSDYYRTTILSEETDPNRLHDLKASLDGYQVYTEGQVDELAALYLGGADRDRLDPLLDACVAVYRTQLDFELTYQAR